MKRLMTRRRLMTRLMAEAALRADIRTQAADSSARTNLLHSAVAGIASDLAVHSDASKEAQRDQAALRAEMRSQAADSSARTNILHSAVAGIASDLAEQSTTVESLKKNQESGVGMMRGLLNCVTGVIAPKVYAASSAYSVGFFW